MTGRKHPELTVRPRSSADGLAKHLNVIKMWGTSTASSSLCALTSEKESVRRCVSHDKDHPLIIA